MKKKDWIIIGAVLLAAVVAYFATSLTSKPPAYVIIYVGGEVYRKVPIDDYCSITIDQGDGKVNVVTIDENGVKMACSSCKNQLCVKQGYINMETADELPLGRWIICLPNGVSVELSEDGEG